MAFSALEMTQIRDYLGWNARWQQFDSALERAFSFIGNLSSGGDTSVEDQVRTLLGKVIAIEGELDAARARFKADQVGSIKLNRLEIRQLVARGESYIGRIARLLGVEVRGASLRADLPKMHASPWGPAGGGGNAQRQG